MKSALMFFVKFPQPGQVKTRLAKSVGDEQAARIYKKLVEKNLNQIRALHGSVCDLWIVFDPPQKEMEIRHWVLGDFYYLAQKGLGLTDRLIHAFSHVFKQGYLSVAVLGSDTLNLSSEIILRAFNELKNHDVVIGPAKDGGYYFLGLTKFSSDVFQTIAWSTSVVLAQTLKNIRDLQWSHVLLDELEDLDDIDNLPAAELYRGELN